MRDLDIVTRRAVEMLRKDAVGGKPDNMLMA